jgi:probable F420-dependent oxidoreductase
MHIDIMTGGLPLTLMQQLAKDTKAAGFSGLVITETGRTAYLLCAAAALAAEIDIATGIAVAFPRSPMITAQTAFELAEASNGRFRLGLGTQVRAHIERRFGTEFDPPGPRLREYVEAVRACFAAFRREAPLNFAGQFYTMSLLPAAWSPGPIAVPNPPIDVSAVNPWMLRMAGQVADGVHVHPLNHARYLTDVVAANIGEGAAMSGRSAADVTRIVPCFTAVGSDEERARYREMARTQVAFYGSTPNYAFIFELLGRPDTTDRIRERQKAGDIAGMSAVIDDELLAHFVIDGPWDEVPDLVRAKYTGVADRVVFYSAGNAWAHDRDHFDALGEAARKITSSS